MEDSDVADTKLLEIGDGVQAQFFFLNQTKNCMLLLILLQTPFCNSVRVYKYIQIYSEI